MRTARRSMTALAATAATVAGTLANAPAATAASSIPEPDNMPRTIEPTPHYVEARSCDQVAKPGVKRWGAFLVRTFPGTDFSLSRPCGTDHRPTSEHYDGRAIDWHVSVHSATGRARAASVISWLTRSDAAGNREANARRVGIMYLIWDNRIWFPGRGWKEYLGCSRLPQVSKDPFCHRDHIHFSLTWSGAWARTSFWDRTPEMLEDYGPCRSRDLNWAGLYSGANRQRCKAYPTVVSSSRSPITRTLVRWSGMWMGPGSRGPVVTALQQALGAPVTGRFDTRTGAAVRALEARYGIAQTGVLDYPTWRALLKHVGAGGGPVVDDPTPAPAPTPSTGHPTLRLGSRGAAVKELQTRLGLVTDGWFGPITKASVIAFQRSHGLAPDGVVGPRTWAAIGGAATRSTPGDPATSSPATSLEHRPQTAPRVAYGDRGPAVLILQQRLGIVQDGWFGPRTKAAVIALQRARGIAPSGVANAETWRILLVKPLVKVA